MVLGIVLSMVYSEHHLMEYVLEYKDSKIESITVTGHPAKYTNYRSLNK